MRYLTIAAIALALMVPNAASAQRHGGSGGGSHPSGGSTSHGGGGGTWHGGGGNWDGGHNHNNYWYPGLAFGLGYAAGSWGWGSPYYGYGYGYYPGYSYSYDYPNYSYDYPSYGYYDNYPRTSSYYEPMNGGYSMSPNRARLEIMVPDPNAELLIQGQRMTVAGNQRVFVSPDLEPGRTYTYTLTLRHNMGGQMQDDTRQIDVQAGSNLRVDFSRPQINTMPAPRPAGERLPPVSPPK